MVLTHHLGDGRTVKIDFYMLDLVRGKKAVIESEIYQQQIYNVSVLGEAAELNRLEDFGLRTGLFVFFSYLRQSWQVCRQSRTCSFSQDASTSPATMALLNEGLHLLSELPQASLFKKCMASTTWRTALRQCVGYV